MTPEQEAQLRAICEIEGDLDESLLTFGKSPSQPTDNKQLRR